MREYRGKRLDGKGWACGQKLQNKIGTYIVTEENPHECTQYGYITIEEYHKVDPSTVGQYTGLPDKNGKRIYEGDVLDGSWLNPMTNEIVKKHYEIAFERGRYLAELIGHHPYGTTMLYFVNENGEVIGNIHDNHELIESIENKN